MSYEIVKVESPTPILNLNNQQDQTDKAEASMREAVARANSPRQQIPGQPPISPGLTDREPKNAKTLPSPS